jgi:hypothetical protein
MKYDEKIPAGACCYERISQLDVLHEVRRLQNTMQVMLQEWDEEEAKYEQFITVESWLGKRSLRRMPRRNYPNEDGVVQDPTLFPYHTSCKFAGLLLFRSEPYFTNPSFLVFFIGYPLLDSYSRLGDYQLKSTDIPPSSGMSSHFEAPLFPCHLPCSEEAITSSLFHLNALIVSSDNPSRTEAANVMLKLLRHALSDLQGDLSLATSIVSLLVASKVLQDVDYYRQLVATVLTNRKNCCGQCRFEDDVDHICSMWKHYQAVLGSTLVGDIPGVFTEAHANIVCAAFKIVLDQASPSTGQKEDDLILGKNGPGSLEKLKHKLKADIYIWNQTDFDDDRSETDDNTNEVIPYFLFGAIVDALGLGAARITDVLLGRTSLPEEQSPDLTCLYRKVATIVYIGEAVIRRLPAKTETINLCGWMVNSLLLSFTGYSPAPSESSQSMYMCAEQKEFTSIIVPDRYARAILTKPTRGAFHVPKDVFDLIRSLFARDLVNLCMARCGYGDCLVWLGGEITANDPFLFFHSHNYPVNIDEEAHAWVNDEVCFVKYFFKIRFDMAYLCLCEQNNVPLVSSRMLESRYDFSLLKLLQAWHAPWSPESHHSFHPPYRSAVRSIILLAHRKELPVDVAYHIIKFVPRSFWPDERGRCWCDECSVDNAVSLMHSKLIGSPAPKMSAQRHCSICGVAIYKNAEHAKKEHAGHRKECSRPPYRIPGREEALLCRTVDAIIRGEEFLPAENVYEEPLDEADDDGDWESIDSNEEEDEADEGFKVTVTNVISDFFIRKTYKSQRVQESAFEALYAAREE